ncbi:MAG: hypothetical protein QOG68_1160, partial [Solirubrobacteraceae bacterium]|nr:hypothetical protein [Solirubrobacteraceae bacterium]
RLKGTAIASTAAGAPAPLVEVHFQSLMPLGDGRSQVRLTSAPFQVPIGGDPNTITEFTPENLCVKAGDHVAFNTEGGFDPTFYPNGTPFRVFGAATGETTNRFTLHNGTGNGSILTPTAMPGTELLMQFDLSYGNAASIPCGGAGG